MRTDWSIFLPTFWLVQAADNHNEWPLVLIGKKCMLMNFCSSYIMSSFTTGMKYKLTNTRQCIKFLMLISFFKAFFIQSSFNFCFCYCFSLIIKEKQTNTTLTSSLWRITTVSPMEFCWQVFGIVFRIFTAPTLSAGEKDKQDYLWSSQYSGRACLTLNGWKLQEFELNQRTESTMSKILYIVVLKVENTCMIDKRYILL